VVVAAAIVAGAALSAAFARRDRARSLGLGGAAGAGAGSAGSAAAPQGAAPPKTGGIASSLTVIVTPCQAAYLAWFLKNATVQYTLESYKDYQPQDKTVDTTCPSVSSARGVTLADVQSHWPGLY